MNGLRAITRGVSARFADCELTHLARAPIDLERARRQHAATEDALRALGVTVDSLPAEDTLPDAVFVEDTAIVFDELAVITRPGAASRRPETASIAAALAPHRTLLTLDAPATLDGGDVMVQGRTVWVGQTTRSNPDALTQLQAAIGPHGYTVKAQAVHGCLHLKSAVTALDDETVLLCPQRVDPGAFAHRRVIEVAPGESDGANVVRVGDTLLAAAAFEHTHDRLREAGYPVVTVALDELAKAEGAVSCCSLLFRDR
ncbi:MAG: arginine deiminase-related protein [Pseudomonadota bacterium]